MPLSWPALAQRPEDIPALAEHCLAKHAQQSGVAIPSIANDAMRQLQSYDWPGNVRELDNVMHRALVLCDANVIQSSDLMLESAVPVECSANPVTPVVDHIPAQPLAQSTAQTEWEALKAALNAEQGRKEKAAQRLGISLARCGTSSQNSESKA